MDTFESIVASVTETVSGLDAAVDVDRRAADIATKMADFQPGRQWAYAPQSEREKVHGQIIAEQEAAAGKELWRLEKTLRAVEPVLRDAIAQSEEPPDPLTALDQWARKEGHSRDFQLQTFALAELYRARFDRELATAQPSTVYAEYTRAILGDPYTPESNALIRFVEQRHRAGWSGAAPASDGEAEAAARLSKFIAGARESRRPAKAVEALALLEAAKKKALYARDIHKITPKNPDR